MQDFSERHVVFLTVGLYRRAGDGAATVVGSMAVPYDKAVVRRITGNSTGLMLEEIYVAEGAVGPEPRGSQHLLFEDWRRRVEATAREQGFEANVEKRTFYELVYKDVKGEYRERYFAVDIPARAETFSQETEIPKELGLRLIAGPHSWPSFGDGFPSPADALKMAKDSNDVFRLPDQPAPP